ncbi:PLP-dependent aminotransferase family protein [Microbulbifer sp. OS29]|uniref:PLP-dependent aminotransferase family protein n=1 Tax=Microbulbifer okhotskensis TaxID=2926617 RepID=A0A9X2EWJ7_9GAMM|nr:PLP-dependent aminotransferase family protein [Microbulbifer okhotskensis]MCO1336723.1 PLP-dependent aminotransferase family protein [Microbulbifer okhotskensis]
MSAPDLADLTLDSTQPLQAQLYRSLVQWICNGRLLAGAKLPSSRRMSETLGISRNTVTLVMEQLKAEGFLTSHPGRGVFVSSEFPSHVKKPKGVSWQTKIPGNLPKLSSYGDAIRQLPGKDTNMPSLPFTPGLPDLNAFPFKLWNRLYRRHLGRKPLAGYGQSQGYLPLRQALAEYLRSSRGVRCNPDQIIITNGAQEALSLCAQVTVNPGDTVLIENPGYRRARLAFHAVGAKLKPAGLINHTLNVGKLIKTTSTARLLFTTPTHQYPMGGVMPADDRVKLLDWAAQFGCWILEDDYDSEFSFQHKPVATLQGMAENTPVLYMGSFSKTLQPSLRLGYLVVPKFSIPEFIHAKEILSGHSPLLCQAVVADFINEGHFVRHLRKMRNNYFEKWTHLCQLIRDQLEPQAQLIASNTGMHLVISTPDHCDTQLANTLTASRFGSTPLSLYYPNRKGQSGLVLGFANTSINERERCINILKEALNK